ncbi:homocysteine S-methyltransferase family protein [Lacibacterium aquatile]|uniref:Homocysteine S-methyltransferase family protein n=1 Tax=Lacibacterium aquatile TaxID=1168082 RepID=A0ABW5DK57_9PROT
MAKYRNALPQLTDKLFLTDGGLETTLIFHDGLDLPYFASFDLLRTVEGTRRLKDYYELYADMAVQSGLGFVLEGVTWRANPDWTRKMNYTDRQLVDAINASVDLMEQVRNRYETPASPMVISGNIGPRGDGYNPGQQMSVAEAEAYHGIQIGLFTQTAIDMVSAFTMTNIPEATGIALAAKRAGLPVVLSFTLETDGRLPTSDTLSDAIQAVDAATGAYPAYYMINCAHPDHFSAILEAGAAWMKRIRGVRANASRRSHEELDNSSDLDAGDPVELGILYRKLRQDHRHLTILGGCCGTDHRHVNAIRLACSPAVWGG